MARRGKKAAELGSGARRMAWCHCCCEGGDGASREGANAMAAWQWWCFDDGGGLEVEGLAVESRYKCLAVKGV